MKNKNEKNEKKPLQLMSVESTGRTHNNKKTHLEYKFGFNGLSKFLCLYSAKDPVFLLVFYVENAATTNRYYK